MPARLLTAQTLQSDRKNTLAWALMWHDSWGFPFTISSAALLYLGGYHEESERMERELNQEPGNQTPVTELGTAGKVCKAQLHTDCTAASTSGEKQKLAASQPNALF